jgi:hypothetical protein
MAQSGTVSSDTFQWTEDTNAEKYTGDKLQMGYVTSTSMNYDKDVNNYNFAKIEETLRDIKTATWLKDQLVDLIYPIGSIYTTIDSIDPETLFGGHWEEITNGQFLRASKTGQAAEGGSETVTLTVNNLPSHSHSLNSHTHTLGDHTHNASDLIIDSKPLVPNRDITLNGSAHQEWTTGSGSGGNWSYLYRSGSSANVRVDTKRLEIAGNTGIASGNTGAASGNTGNTGSGTPFSILPPYITVHIWKRTA